MDYSCSVDQHGTHRLELELIYPIPAKEIKSRYAVDLYMFMPVQMGLTRERYGVQGFLHDLKSYTRYGLCNISLDKLADAACDLSPLTRLDRMIQGMTAAADFDTARALYELKILVDLHHDEVAARRKLFGRQLKEGSSEAALRQELSAYLSDTRTFLETVRALYTKFMDPKIPEEIRQALRLTDESVSIKAEKELHRVCIALEESGRLADVTDEVERLIAREQAYRQQMEFPSVAGADFSVQNEQYVYRESNLKKWAQSSTYMTQEADKTPIRIGHILAGVAAAIAMAFAVAAALLAQKYYAMNSLPWAILIVMAYMLKDRIKEVVRNRLISRLPALIADRVVRLIDPLGCLDVGQSRERVRFCDSADIPDDVRQMRNLKSDSFRSILPAERVIHFRKSLLLKSRQLLENHQRLASIMEIIRINMSTWLGEMDDPVDELFAMKDGCRFIAKTRRVYHINLVVRLSSGQEGEQSAMFKYRLIMTRNGIERIETVC